MTTLERLLAERPRVVCEEAIGPGGQPLPVDHPHRDACLQLLEVRYRDPDVILYYEGWEFDWEEKVLHDTPDGFVVTELLTDLTGVQDGDPKPGDQQVVQLTWGDDVNAKWLELGMPAETLGPEVLDG